MSVKRFAMLSAISYYNQQNYNSDNKNNTNYNNYNEATFTTTITPESTTEIIINNKSTLTQLKQQQQQQQQQQSPEIIAPLVLNNTNTLTTTTKVTSSASLVAHPSYSDKVSTTTIIDHKNYHPSEGVKNDDDFISDILGDDISNYSNESNESLDLGRQKARPDHQPSNTYTSTTYYGSGFGVFHQQNIRSNGGGIALISGSSASNGLGGGSYSNGINNNVNLLLGGAMLTLITTILCVVCYCCHRNIKKRTEAAYRQQRQWLENDPNMEIYSVEQCYETSGLFVGDSMDGLATIPALHHEPPPSYDAVVAMQEQQQQLVMQQHQQQILMQQQLLQQQLATSSPPPGYRSSLDVRSIIQQSRGTDLGCVLAMGGSIVSGMEINSLASSSANLRTATSISPVDPLLNYNDANGNVATVVPVSTATPTNNRNAACYLRNKQQQQQRSIPAANQMSQLNMKKVLQAQSCCSLQRAEVESMWNAAAAALAARSAHLPSDSRATNTACSSSPTLATNTRKQSQGCKTFNPSTPETFGTRYLKQNYYRRGCPLCGKFRYDNESTLSVSMESNLDTLPGALTEEPIAGVVNNNCEATSNIANNNENQTGDFIDQHLQEEGYEDGEDNGDNNNDARVLDDEMDDNDNEAQQQCSCLNSIGKNEINSTAPHSYQNINPQQESQTTEEQEIMETSEPESKVLTTASISPDHNANSTLTTERQSTNQTASNNNSNTTNMEDHMNSPARSTSTDTTIPYSSVTAVSTTSMSSAPSANINLDCINENGIISLDMSKIIDKTGLPTYDAALKLESSGYV